MISSLLGFFFSKTWISLVFWQNFCSNFLFWPALLQSYLNFYLISSTSAQSKVSEFTNKKVFNPTSPNDVINTPARELQNIQPGLHLKGKNYLKWSQFVRTFVKGKGKLSHLLRTGLKPNDSQFVAWDEEDSMLMS